jgi:hypothetical protein
VRASVVVCGWPGFWAVLLFLTLSGCDQQPPRQVAYSPPPVVSPDVWQSCLKQEIVQRVTALWAASAARGEWPPSIHAQIVGLDETTVVSVAVSRAGDGHMEEIPEAALEKCVPSYVVGSKYNGSFAQTFADSTYQQAKNEYVRQIVEIEKERDAKKAAENQAALKREEPPLWAALHTCAFEGAARLALVSDEPAEAIVAATFAACRPQRTALIELHKRCGDLAFTDEMMDKVEARVAGALVLEVIRARAAKAAPGAPTTPPPLSAPPRPIPGQPI